VGDRGGEVETLAADLGDDLTGHRVGDRDPFARAGTPGPFEIALQCAHDSLQS
jgi:hypothetical protein